MRQSIPSSSIDNCAGVSELHGEVSREMWHCLWPDRKIQDVPIGYITNGVFMAAVSVRSDHLAAPAGNPGS